jgi:hypothetical protein
MRVARPSFSFSLAPGADSRLGTLFLKASAAAFKTQFFPKSE